MDCVILHSDMNSCYANIELLHHPELRGRPLAVGGDPEARHGIVLAKDELAKRAGVKTGMALWQARQVCPEIIFVPPRMDLYLRFSRLAHELYGEYTDQQEAFGIDESWLDVTASCSLKGDGMTIAKEISRRVKQELGITVSIGVSWNKIYAKLGSDYKKPDAITEFNRMNYKEKIYPLPAGDLLYVGSRTEKKLVRYGIRTIGQLAEADPGFLHLVLGKMGYILRAFARGEDRTPVSKEYEQSPIKSIGNGTTTPRDLTCEEDAAIVFYLLAESVAARLREHQFQCRTVEITVRDKELFHFSRQRKLAVPTDITEELAETARAIFHANYSWEKPIRSLGLRACALVPNGTPYQSNLLEDPGERERQQRMDRAVDEIRRRYGFASIQRGLALTDASLRGLNAKEDHTVHPHGYMQYGNRTGAELLYR